MGFRTPQFKIGTLLDWAPNGQVQLPAVRDLAASGTEAGTGAESPEAFDQVEDDLDSDDLDALENEELSA